MLTICCSSYVYYYYTLVGTANSALLSICESCYKHDLPTEQLIEVAKNSLKLALQRDVLSGCKMRLLVLTNKGDLYESHFRTEDA